MSIYAIADLHLSFSVEKPMDIYGGEWVNHIQRLKSNWESMITEEDTIIIPGDSSWALRYEEALPDLAWISDLPGKKVLIKGNHDLWWTSVSKLNQLYPNLYFLQNTFYEAEGFAICGTRGWICPGDDDFTQHDQKIYKRELGRLKLSLDAAVKAGFGKDGQEGRSRIIGVLHFPPVADLSKSAGFLDLFEEYGVIKVVYGHLHGKDAYGNGIKGIRNGVEYILTSTDYLKCMPYRLL
ncbi:metallophosphoesterase [Sinanaerobacter chloroacetimidivorans]|jgi:predicted phosphohydrolase|uniref:Metallophosphoesterase n=1 Tax=Sinanaerobacter chloroacetimidivorans TaxID=2818044 RepID=A0A8J7W6N7_9FIRM|nr:metallophosphoesterase [Sinanaerobacter chloroacetimidivorans]MBR0600001.1 metallophosphoesterase [Sinanaerobacter chloroacetimidivorans]